MILIIVLVLSFPLICKTYENCSNISELQLYDVSPKYALVYVHVHPMYLSLTCICRVDDIILFIIKLFLILS